MKARIQNIATLIPDAVKAGQALGAAAAKTGVPTKTLNLIYLRASQINGCGVCVDMHPRHMRKSGETDERLHAVAAWRDTPYFTDPERAVLALTESLTRISDREDAVADAIWNEAARHFSEQELAGLVIAISTINLFNRFNVATRQIAGALTW